MSSPQMLRRLLAVIGVVALGVLCSYHLLRRLGGTDGEQGFRQVIAEFPVFGFPSNPGDGDLAEDGFPGYASDGTPAEDINLLGDPPLVGEQIIEKLSLTDLESEELQLIVDAMWSEMKQLAREHVKLDPLRTDDENGIICLRLRIPREEGDRVHQKFTQKLYGAFDERVANRMARAFDIQKHQYFGSFGRKESFLRYKVVDEDKVFDDGNIAVIVEECDPETGEFSSGWLGDRKRYKEMTPTVPYEHIKNSYGDLLEAVGKQ